MATIEYTTFDSGGLQPGANNTDDGSVITLEPPRTYSGSWWWWAAKIVGLAGQSRTFHVLNANTYNQLPAWHILAVWTATPDDPESWREFDTVTVGSTYQTFSNAAPFTDDVIYVARYPMFPMSRITARVAEWTAGPYAFETPSSSNFVVATLPAITDPFSGRPVPALPVYGFLLTDGSVAAFEKQRIFLMGGEHVGETPGSFALEGALDLLALTNDPDAVYLRQRYEIYVYPMLGPSGRYAGYYRSEPHNPLVPIGAGWDPSNAHHPYLEDTLKTVFAADVGTTKLVASIGYHSYVTAGGTNGNQDAQDPIFTGAQEWQKNATFRTRMQSYRSGYGYALFTYGTAPGYTGTPTLWLRYNQNDTNALVVSMLAEVNPRVGDTVADWRTYGEQTMRTLAAMSRAGELGATDVAPPPASVVVTDLQYRLGTVGSFTALPTQPEDDTSYTLTTSGFPAGTLQVEIRSRDTSDDLASAWVRRSFGVDHGVVVPPPAGAYFVFDGVAYDVLAEGVRELEAEPAQGELVRAFDGTQLSTTDGEIRRLQLPLLNLDTASHATLRAAIARQRRRVAGGLFMASLVGLPAGSTALVTAELDEDAYEWESDGSATRLPVLTLRLVDRV